MKAMLSSTTMMDLSSKKSKDNCLEPGEDKDANTVPPENVFKPKDLSVKTNIRRPKPIPPPLNLKNELSEYSVGISTPLKEFAILATGPHSPLIQKNLPFRKRAHSVPDADENAPYSAPPTVLKFFPALFKQEKSGEDSSSPPLNLSLPPTPKGFRDREPESPHESAGVVSSTRPEVASPLISSSSHPTSPHPVVPKVEHPHLAPNPFSRHHIPPWNPFLTTPSIMSSHWLNGSPSALLSPAPSSLGSSQEDLRHTLPLTSVSSLVYESDPWRLPWPYPVWHCFQLGTLLRFSINGSEIVLRAEEVQQCSELQYLTTERLGPVQVLCINPIDGQSGVVEISFTCVSPTLSGDVKLVATCFSHHTFLVMEKGWCAASPEAVLRQYGIQCQALECGDNCALPPKMPPVSSPGICEKFKRFSFSPDELGSTITQTPSSLILSPPNTPTMKSHHQQKIHQSNQPTSSQSSKASKSSKQTSNNAQQNTDKHTKPSKKVPLDPNRPKRPMNAFMLFAKQHRLKLIRMHPGKDNRFVSVILGEAWRQLPADEKEVFITEAKALSSERKRLHPECWKRKRYQVSPTPGGVKVLPPNE